MNTQRLGRVTAVMASEGVSALLVTDWANICWLTGFTGSAGVVYVTREGEPVLVTDGRYAERAADEAPGTAVLLDRTWGWLADSHPRDRELAVEADHMTLATAQSLRELDPDLTLRPTSGLLQTLRQRKDATEIAALRQACAITGQAFEDALGWLAPGLTEIAVARRLVATMIDLGADGPAFAPIVAAGLNGSRPHHDPTGARLAAGDLITMDFGALVDGYHADMTRTVSLGDPDPSLIRIHDVVHDAQQAGVQAAVVGASTQQVDSACREPIGRAGHAEEFVHGTGHGVGLAIHETPFLGRNSPGTLADRMTVTVEPGVYVAGLGGVRIEDVVLVAATGSERLTTAPRQLIRL
ncbi:MAG: M24 family metallopeptidase [Euzebya sp.]